MTNEPPNSAPEGTGHPSPFAASRSSHRRRPPLFALMLGAFALVIVLGVCGMVGTVGLTVGSAMRSQDGTGFGGDWRPDTPFSPTPEDAESIRASGGNVGRGLITGGLVVAVLLLGLATFFSRRISRPISRLTVAARTMAAGDLSVRVAGNRVREINDLAEAFNSMAGSIAAADGQRRQLTADVAHELRTPLSIIKGRLEGMQDGVYAPSPGQITLLLNETALLERMIEDLRILAQADAGQLPLYLEQVQPEGLLDAAARSFAPQAEAGGVAIQVSTNGGLPEVDADPQRISQVLSNLVSNALRHTPPGGTITLRAWMEPAGGGLVNISVQDTGSGIAPEDLPHIFDRFWKADRARSRSGGAGLGLAIARRIVEAHGGRIWADSTPYGTTVGFSLKAIGE
ncbi:MAG: HAMP domain-containing sensor histidine kinase [Chloroflexia bacterium]